MWRGFIQIPIFIAIVVGIAILGGGGYFVAHEIGKTQKIGTESNFQATTTPQKQATTTSEKSEIDKLKEEVAKLKKQQNTPAKIDTQINKAPSVPAQPTPPIPQALTLSQVIKNWRPRIAKITCTWAYTDTGIVYQKASGSGLVFNDSSDRGAKSSGVWVMTNSHVLLVDGKYSPDICSITLPGESTVFYTDKTITASGSPYGAWISLGIDLGEIEIRKPTQHVVDLLASEDTTDDAFCKFVPDIGDQVAIVGYPGIGASEDITATEGIISGFDGDYYITSAKIEHGNSGGVAISIKNNCILGIPTFVEVGEAETLGRILSSKAISRIFAPGKSF